MAEISAAEFTEMCQEICPLCKKGVSVHFREQTHEWQHNAVTQPVGDKRAQVHSVSICWASGLRQSRFNPSKA
jgi:hypothetical protein